MPVAKKGVHKQPMEKKSEFSGHSLQKLQQPGINLLVGTFIGPCIQGALLFIFSTVLLTWSMLVNTHFETIVRIQKDRNHRVITTGPYSCIRHPGYVGASLLAISAPLIVGSVCGLIPSGMAVHLLLVRTALEDRTLQRELSGYSEYVRQVRYRLIPGLW